MYPVLVVDDEYFICEDVRHKLENLGLNEIGEVRTCLSGEDALELCQTFKPPIIITDIKMH